MDIYLLAWLASIAYGILAVVIKLTSKHLFKNPWAFNFFWNLFNVIFTLPIIFIYHAGMPHAWGYIILGALMNTVWVVLYIFSNYKLDVSVMSPLFNFRTIFAVVLGTIFLREHLNLTQTIMFFVVIVAGFFVSLDEKYTAKSFFNLGVGMAILGMLFLAASNLFINLAVVDNGVWTTTLWLNILTLILLLPTIFLFKKDIKNLSWKQTYPFALIGLIDIVGTLAANSAFGINLSITAIILAMPVSFILAVIFSVLNPELLEHHTFKIYTIRFIASLVMIAAGLKLSM